MNCLAGKRNFYYGLVAGVGLTILVLLAGTGFLVAGNFSPLLRLASVVTLIRTQALQPVEAAGLIEGAAKGLVGSLDDPYSAYLGPEEYRQMETHISGEYGGVGLLIGLDDEKRLVVVSPFKGTPAQRAGILAGDRILAVDGEDTSEMELDQAAQKMQGEPGTRVRLTLYREEGKRTWEVELTREQIEVPTVEEDNIPGYPEVAFVRLSMFNEHTGRELGKVLRDLPARGARALILDLRNNPGGSLDAAVEVADALVPEGPIVHIVDRYRTETYQASGEPLGLPLAVLVNGGSASASEIVAGAVKDRKAGVIVGEKTFGKGLVQTVFPLQGGAAVKLTTAKYLTPAKNDINKKGIEPDVEVKLTPEQATRVLAGPPDPRQDPQLRRALEVVRERQARR